MNKQQFVMMPIGGGRRPPRRRVRKKKPPKSFPEKIMEAEIKLLETGAQKAANAIEKYAPLAVEKAADIAATALAKGVIKGREKTISGKAKAKEIYNKYKPRFVAMLKRDKKKLTEWEQRQILKLQWGRHIDDLVKDERSAFQRGVPLYSTKEGRRMKDVTKKELEAYEAVRSSGATNMFDTRVVSDLSGLDREKILTIIKNYDSLMKKYPKVRKDFSMDEEVQGWWHMIDPKVFPATESQAYAKTLQGGVTADELQGMTHRDALEDIREMDKSDDIRAEAEKMRAEAELIRATTELESLKEGKKPEKKKLKLPRVSLGLTLPTVPTQKKETGVSIGQPTQKKKVLGIFSKRRGMGMGWFNEPKRHGLAARGIKTRRKR